MELFIARVSKRLTQWELARKSGISPSQLSLFEHGYRLPSPEVMEKIAKVLDIPVDEIEWPILNTHKQ